MKPGQIFTNRRGSSLIIERLGECLVVCEVAARTTVSHRADFLLKFGDQITAGLKSDVPIRCVPRRIKIPFDFKVTGYVSDSCLDEIRALASAEYKTARKETANEPRMVSSVYNR